MDFNYKTLKTNNEIIIWYNLKKSALEIIIKYLKKICFDSFFNDHTRLNKT